MKLFSSQNNIYKFDNIGNMKLTKKEIWKYEKPIYSLNVNIHKTGYFYIPRSFLRENGLDENCAILYRFSKNKSLYSTNKISKVRKNDYVLTVQKKVFDVLKIKTPKRMDIEIIQIKKFEKEKINKGNDEILDLTQFLPENSVCFERPGNWITIYHISNKTVSTITLPRFLRLDEFSLWNFGFYLAEGFKGKYRFALGNNKSDLLKKFRDFGEEYFGLERDEWYLEVRVKNVKPFILDFWSKKLNIYPRQIRVRKQKKNPPKSKYGGASLIIYNKIIATIINKLIYNSNFYEMLNSKKDFKLYFIRGLEAGDGTVMHHNGCMEMGITCTLKELEIIKSIYSGLFSKEPFVKRYHTSKNAWFIFHRGTKLAIEYILGEHFKEHEERRKKLIRLYLEKTKKQIKYLKALNSGIMTIRDISNYTNVTYPGAKSVINDFVKYGFIKPKKSQVKKGNRFYKTREFIFTKKGKKLLEYLNLN